MKLAHCFWVLVFSLVFNLVSCGATQTKGSAKENSVVNLGQNFDAQVNEILREIAKNPDSEVSGIGEFLQGCETGYGTYDGFKVEKEANHNCLIVLLKKSTGGVSTLDQILKDHTKGREVIAATLNIAGSDYPVIVLVEGLYDKNFLIRTLVHQGLHVTHMKAGANYLDPWEEENLSYELQFKVLELQYSPDELKDFNYALPGTTEQAFNALEMEHRLYLEYKSKKLPKFLMELGVQGEIW